MNYREIKCYWIFKLVWTLCLQDMSTTIQLIHKNWIILIYMLSIEKKVLIQICPPSKVVVVLET